VGQVARLVQRSWSGLSLAAIAANALQIN